MGTTIQEEVRQGLAAWYDALPQDAITAAENALQQVDTEEKSGAYILPNRVDIFRAFQLTTPQNIKFVLVGQDPYPTIGHAMGLAFSVRRDVKPFPRSLQNIFKELRNDLGIPVPETGDLSAWAQQGGLLLNTSLTVEAGKANSHWDIGWGPFTRRVLDYVAGLSQPLVFLQWGMQAVKTTPAAALDRTDRVFIRSTHPSPLAANRASKELPAFMGSTRSAAPMRRSIGWDRNQLIGGLHSIRRLSTQVLWCLSTWVLNVQGDEVKLWNRISQRLRTVLNGSKN